MKVKIVTVVAGGVLQSVYASEGVEVDLSIIDCDNIEDREDVDCDAEIEIETAGLTAIY